jgi:cyclophilin family peptidyl-prolyl cis-trans isomerase
MPTMRKFLIVPVAILALLPGLTGCGGKPHPVLFEPGQTRVWDTVDSKEMERYRESLTKVELDTSMGTIVIELYADRAPVTVANFLQYVKDGFYSGTIFHRVEPGLVVQGGGFTTDMQQKPTRDPVINEAGNGLRNLRGTVGLARTMEMASGTSQFYVNLVDNPSFNGDGVTSGYAVFGRVYQGMDVIDAMAMLPTQSAGGLNGVPVNPVVIRSATVLE